MTELSDALARGEDFPGLSAAELAAAKADGHLSMCRETYFADCDECPMLLAKIQRLVRLVRPAIEADVRRAYFTDDAAVERDWLLAEAPDDLRARFFEVRASVEKPVGRHAVHERSEEQAHG